VQLGISELFVSDAMLAIGGGSDRAGAACAHLTSTATTAVAFAVLLLPLLAHANSTQALPTSQTTPAAVSSTTKMPLTTGAATATTSTEKPSTSTDRSQRRTHSVNQKYGRPKPFPRSFRSQKSCILNYLSFDKFEGRETNLTCRREC